MLGRKTYSQQEIDHARSAVEEQLGVHGKLARAAAGGARHDARAVRAHGVLKGISSTT
jgi:hypothetical protein